MSRSIHRLRQSVVLASLLCFFQICPAHLMAEESAVKMKKFTGTLDQSTSPSRFTLEGQASHLGQFRSYGEIVLAPGEQPGTLVGTGVVVFEAANGDLLVGQMTWNLSSVNGDERAGQIHFRWADSVTFDDGTVVSNTGRFVTDRPPGLIVIVLIINVFGTVITILSGR